uniref:Taperin n=1 Tax=Gopherus evgoodei TaxID=1825980 RepID=A0A8C4WG39_9SAUR
RAGAGRLCSAGGPALPVWKREILERKRAKLAEPPAGGEPEPGGGGGRAGPALPEERLVLADSLGPLRENPFMRLESERRRLRQGLPGGGRRGAGRPLQELLELYSAVPGIRTIRADNILIIESQPDAAACFIRAAQVFVYEPVEPGQAGRVSRLLQKFDQWPRGRRRRSRDADAAAPRPLPAPGSSVSAAAPQRVPGPPASPPVPGPPASPPNRRAPASPVSTAAPPGTSQASGFLHKIGSNSFTVTPRGLRPGSCAPLTNGPLEHNASPGGRAPRAKVPPVPSPSVSLASDNMRPKLEMSKEIQPSLSSATPSPLQPLSVSVLRDGVSFEIRPAPKPDLAAIPAHDLQAQALANLRLNSRNSFLFVPRRGGGQCLTEPAGDLSSLKPVCEQQGEPITPSQTPQELLVPVTYIDDDIVELDAGGLPQEMGPDAGLKDSEQPQEATSALGMKASAIPLYRPHPASSALQQRGSNTFTIVPKRKPPNSGVEVDSGASRIQQSEEEDNEESRSKGKTLGSPDAPQPDLEPLLKKRYPTVNEIEVIGGYLSLERSCMSKMGSRPLLGKVTPCFSHVYQAHGPSCSVCGRKATEVVTASAPVSLVKPAQPLGDSEGFCSIRYILRMGNSPRGVLQSLFRARLRFRCCLLNRTN